MQDTYDDTIHHTGSHLDEMTRCLALAPPPLPRPAVKGRQPAITACGVCLMLPIQALSSGTPSPPTLPQISTPIACTQSPYPVWSVSTRAASSQKACMRISPVSTCCTIAGISPWASHLSLERGKALAEARGRTVLDRNPIRVALRVLAEKGATCRRALDASPAGRRGPARTCAHAVHEDPRLMAR